jgi:hypothetical protein
MQSSLTRQAARFDRWTVRPEFVLGGEFHLGGIMNIKRSLILVLVVASAVPLSVNAKKKSQPDRGMLENMDAVACGAKQRGLSGLGSLWASVGVTHVNSDEKVCPQYLLRTDDMEYEIRPTDSKHPALLQVGQEAEFKIKNSRIFLKVPEGGDGKTRSYEVVAMRPTSSDNDARNVSSKSSDKP